MSSPASTADPDLRGAGLQRSLVALIQVLGLAVWFSATAIAPTLRGEWGLGDTSVVWLTGAVQIGFVVGALTSSVLNLPDRMPPQRLVALCAFGAAGSTALLAALADGLWLALPLRFLTGAFLAGVYPVGMKLMASWSLPVDRGRAFGVLVGALTLGSALPHLISASGPLPWRAVMLTASALTLGAGVVALTVLRPGPLLAPGQRPRARHALAGLRTRAPLLANLGYFGHMWELYALWTWLPAFLVHQPAWALSGAGVSALTFLTVGVAGLVGALLGGWGADRYGRSPAAVAAMATSAGCCLLAPLLWSSSPALLVVFLLVWGASVIADSGVFSTALSESADQRYVGTALSVQTAIGFTLSVVTIQLLPLLADAVGWRWAFWLLAPGPALGALAMLRLGRITAPRRS